MKTEIRTFIAVVALGLIWFTNINATTDHKSEINANVVTETEESLTIESWMLENTSLNTKTEVDTIEVEKTLEIESWMLD